MKITWRQLVAGGVVVLGTGGMAWAASLTAPTTAARFVSTGPAPATMPGASTVTTASAPATQPQLDLATPQGALKSMLRAQGTGDLVTVRKCLVFPAQRDREAWEYEVAPWVARVGLARAAVARFKPTGGEDVILLHEVDEAITGQIKGIGRKGGGLKLTVRGNHATLRRAGGGGAAATTQAGTNTQVVTAPARTPAGPGERGGGGDDSDEAGGGSVEALELQLDAAGQWRVIAGVGDLVTKIEDEEFVALKKAVPAKLELYTRLRKEIELADGTIADYDAYLAKLEAGEALIMEQILNDPEKPATLPTTLPATRPVLAEPPPLDLHATADTKPAPVPAATQLNHQDTKAPR